MKSDKKLADTVTRLTGDEKEAFLDLASHILQWLPEKRKTARELMEYPFFEKLHKCRAQYNGNNFEEAVDAVGRLELHDANSSVTLLVAEVPPS